MDSICCSGLDVLFHLSLELGDAGELHLRAPEVVELNGCIGSVNSLVEVVYVGLNRNCVLGIHRRLAAYIGYAFVGIAVKDYFAEIDAKGWQQGTFCRNLVNGRDSYGTAQFVAVQNGAFDSEGFPRQFYVLLHISRKDGSLY